LFLLQSYFNIVLFAGCYLFITLNLSSPSGAYMNVTLYFNGWWWYSSLYNLRSWK